MNRFYDDGIIIVPDDYSSIQDAIDHANPGDTIIVRDGTYVENINVSKDNLTIRSENGSESVIIKAADPDEDVFKIVSNNINIYGFTIERATGIRKAGIYIHKSTSCNVSNNIFKGNWYGIRLNHALNNNLINNILVSNSKVGIYLECSSDNNVLINTLDSNNDGIFLRYSSNNYLAHNTMIFNSYSGIGDYRSSDNIIVNNTVKGSDIGFYLIYSEDDILIENRAYENNYSICIDRSSKIIMRKNEMVDNEFNFDVRGAGPSDFYHDIDNSNTIDGRPIYYFTKYNAPNNGRDFEISDATGFSDAGFVALVSCSNVTVKNLNIHDNSVGILLVNTTDSRISNNTLTNNKMGIYLGSSSRSNTMIHNIVNDNEYGIYLWGYYLNDRPVSATDNIIAYNIVKRNGDGILILHRSDRNTITNNIISFNKGRGIWMYSSNRDVITLNNISYNEEEGIYLDSCFNSRIYHNNFIRNHPHVYFLNTILNRWYENYWDNWNGIGPKILYGKREIIFGIFYNDFYIFIPLLNFDWHPALKPIRGV